MPKPTKLYLTISAVPLGRAIREKRVLVMHTVVIAETSGVDLVSLVKESIKHVGGEDGANLPIRF